MISSIAKDIRIINPDLLPERKELIAASVSLIRISCSVASDELETRKYPASYHSVGAIVVVVVTVVVPIRSGWGKRAKRCAAGTSRSVRGRQPAGRGSRHPRPPSAGARRTGSPQTQNISCTLYRAPLGIGRVPSNPLPVNQLETHGVIVLGCRAYAPCCFRSRAGAEIIAIDRTIYPVRAPTRRF